MLEVNPQGSVPVVKDGETGEWFTDSAKFVDYLEDKQPEPALGKTPDVPEVGSQVFPKFVAAIKAAPEDKSQLQPVVEVNFTLLYACFLLLCGLDHPVSPHIRYMVWCAKSTGVIEYKT